MPGQNQTKGIKKLLITKKVRNRACREDKATETAIADCLGRQNLTKELLSGLRAPMPRRITSIKRTDGDMT
jgi:hypothetical protein